MGTDFKILAEICKDTKWDLLCTQKSSNSEPWESSLSGTNIVGYIFCGMEQCGWYDYSNMKSIHDDFNGLPVNVSLAGLVIHNLDIIRGFITSEDIRKYDWNFEIVFDGYCLQEDADKFYLDSTFPESFASCYGISKQKIVHIVIKIPFKEIYKDFFEDIKYLASLGDDFRLIYYTF
jgi:hypothetical protein